MAQLAYLNGNLISEDELAISVFDLGFVQGTTVSEQLRTFAGNLFRLEQHTARLTRSLSIAGLDCIDIQTLIEEAKAIVSHNHSLMLPQDDLGLTVFVTPGLYGLSDSGSERHPTVGMFTTPLPFHRWAEKYSSGEGLVVSDIRQVPNNCWPAELKCRSRMHYFLADREVAERFPGARAVLLDQEGFVAEASTASVLLYNSDEGLVAPGPEKVLPGVSVSVVKALCDELTIPFIHRNVTVEDLETADEVFLASTSPCILPVISVGQHKIGDGNPGPVFHKLIDGWSRLIDVDIISQAARFSCR